MNFMQWLNSLDELLYEIMSWLIFFPITLWRAIRHPLRMMDYSDKELHDPERQQFTDTLNPPLFLVLALVLSHAIELAIGGGVNPIVARTSGLAGLVSDDTSLLFLRLVLFAIFPLMMATRLVRARGLGLTRERLKSPFYAQCYSAAPFALFLGIGFSVAQTGLPLAPAGLAAAALATVCYLVVQAYWFARHLHRSVARGALHALAGFAGGLLFVIAVALLLAR